MSNREIFLGINMENSSVLLVCQVQIAAPETMIFFGPLL
jgi:hypothetical protein